MVIPSDYYHEFNLIIYDSNNYTMLNKVVKGNQLGGVTYKLKLSANMWPPGEYTIKAINEMRTLTSAILTIQKNNLTNYLVIKASNITKTYGKEERLSIQITDNNIKPMPNKEVKIIINGQTYKKTTNFVGYAHIGLNLNSGVYLVTIMCENFSTQVTITVKSTIDSKNIVKVFRNGTDYSATFIDSQGNLLKNTKVKFNINGVFYERTTDRNGVAQLRISLNPGTYIITATNPSNNEMQSSKVTVLPNMIGNKDIIKYYRNGTQYTVKLLYSNGKTVGEGVSVYLNINGVFYIRDTNSDGIAKLNLNLQPGEYIITAEYNGLRASNTIKVLPILSAKDINMKYRDGTKFEVKLLDGKGKPFAAQKITFNINGVFYERITDSNGIARLNINLMAGEYIITSMYENGAALANKVTIRS